MSECRKPQTRYKTTNWSEYNTALKARSASWSIYLNPGCLPRCPRDGQIEHRGLDVSTASAHPIQGEGTQGLPHAAAVTTDGLELAQVHASRNQ